MVRTSPGLGVTGPVAGQPAPTQGLLRRGGSHTLLPQLWLSFPVPQEVGCEGVLPHQCSPRGHLQTTRQTPWVIAGQGHPLTTDQETSGNWSRGDQPWPHTAWLHICSPQPAPSGSSTVKCESPEVLLRPTVGGRDSFFWLLVRDSRRSSQVPPLLLPKNRVIRGHWSCELQSWHLWGTPTCLPCQLSAAPLSTEPNSWCKLVKPPSPVPCLSRCGRVQRRPERPAVQGASGAQSSPLRADSLQEGSLLSRSDVLVKSWTLLLFSS